MSARSFRLCGSGPTFPLAVVATLAGALCACVDDPAEPPSAWPVTLQLMPVGEGSLPVGETVSLTAEARDRQGRMMSGQQVRWTSDDTLVAKVDTAGIVTAVGEGTATITATAGAATATVQFAVADPTWAVLYALYVSTGGDNWTNNDNWLENDSLHTWHGVVWDPPCHLGLVLEDNELRGKIPPELGDLNCLGELDLSGNHLTGEIPEELSALNLWRLDLSGNRLTGLIPTGIGGSSLQQLDLSSNDLMGSIPVDTAWSRLWTVSLDNNRLTGSIPFELGKLGRLDHLSLRGNQLTGTIPPELGNLASLDNLNLSDNNLSGPIPPEFGNISGLDTLWLSHNRLSGSIPSELGNLTGLDVLWLSHNELTGALPSEIGNLEDLDWLIVGNNALSGPLRLSLAELELGVLGYANTDLCIPADNTFQQWLDSIPRHESTQLYCADLTDREILERFYVAAGGPNWVNKYFWLTDEPLERWYGVSTDSAGRVVGLSLIRNNLTGAVAPQLGYLDRLEYLWFSRNNLSGGIPPELGNLANLESLSFRGSGLRGMIPPELGKLTKLTELHLNANNLTNGIPPELGSLANLESLNLAYNDLTGAIPPELGSLTSLTWLGLQTNELTGDIPPTFGELESLKHVWIYGNPLTGPLPLFLSDLAELVTLDYEDTMLCVPLDHSFRAWLESIDSHRGTAVDCDDRYFLELFYHATGGPNWTNNTNWLADKDIGEWYGAFVADSVGRVTALQLDGNNLTGYMPEALGELDSLTLLNLSFNGLTGHILPELGNLHHLEYLYLQSNQLTSTIPPKLGSLANLKQLILYDNQLTGSVPAEMSQLANLESLRLEDNMLTGVIPEDLGDLSNLVDLGLGRNELTGGIPSELGSLDSLEWLFLGDNKLTGTIPTELGDLVNLTSLHISNNMLTGAIPAALGRLRRLSALDLGENRLTDSIPSELGSLDSLRFVDLSDNDLTGVIPAGVWSLTQLFELELGGNRLTGRIPAEIGSLARLRRLDLSDNQLVDTLPSELGDLDSLYYFALQSNPLLSGGLPLSVAGLSLRTFYYWGTDLCIPQDTAFQAWLESIPDHNGTEVYCPVPTAKVSGTVRSGGDPVHGVTILVNGGRPIGATQDYTTGEDGTYLVTVPVGNVTISAWKSDMSFSPKSHSARATEGIFLSGFDFAGFAHATISGRVVTTDDGLLGGVTVTATPAGGGPATESHTTDARGVYSLSVPFGYYTIDASRPGYSFGARPTVNAAPGQAISVADLTATATAEPVNVAARRDTTDNGYDTTATVTWDVGPGGKAKSYRVQTRQGGGSWTAAGDAVDSASITNDSVSTSIGNVPEDAFSVRVLAILGDSDQDTIPSVAVAVAAVNPLPGDLEATRNTDAEPDSLVLTWEARGNAQSRWRVAISSDDGADWYVAQGTANGGSWGTTLESTNFSIMANADPEESDTQNATPDELNGAFMIPVDYRQGETDGEGQVFPWEVGPTATMGAK